jgi:hypothetical protein
MLLPFPVLLQSRIQTRKKLVLLGLFGLGIFITVIQIIRIQTVAQLSNYTDSAPLILWSTVENNLGIIVANVPTLAPLVKYYSERSSRGGSRGGSTAGGRGSTACRGQSGRGGTAVSGASGKREGGRVISWYGGCRDVWRSRAKEGMETLTSNAAEMGSFEEERVGGGGEEGGGGGHGRSKNGSKDLVLLEICRVGGGNTGEVDVEASHHDRCVTPGGITKKVEVVITRS